MSGRRQLVRLRPESAKLGSGDASGLLYSQHFSPNRSAGRRDGTGAATDDRVPSIRN
jgi:hypothetical protein